MSKITELEKDVIGVEFDRFEVILIEEKEYLLIRIFDKKNNKEILNKIILG